jgi:AhpD family alkylhydroperoxidase
VHRPPVRVMLSMLCWPTKELIALAIGVSKECDGCIAAHAHAAVLHGAGSVTSCRSSPACLLPCEFASCVLERALGQCDGAHFAASKYPLGYNV